MHYEKSKILKILLCSTWFSFFTTEYLEMGTLISFKVSPFMVEYEIKKDCPQLYMKWYFIVDN